jgi:hypothetical protein
MLPRPRIHAALAAWLIATAAGACATSSFDGSVFRGPRVSFQVAPIPASWHRLDVADSDLAFRDDAREASILVNSRCASSDSDAPLVALGGHLIMGTTDRHVTREEVIPFDGREALHTALTARLDGVPMAYDIYVLKKDGCVYDLVYLTVPAAGGGDAGGPPEAPPEWGQFVRGFHTLGRHQGGGA